MKNVVVILLLVITPLAFATGNDAAIWDSLLPYGKKAMLVGLLNGLVSSIYLTSMLDYESGLPDVDSTLTDKYITDLRNSIRSEEESSKAIQMIGESLKSGETSDIATAFALTIRRMYEDTKRRTMR